MLALIINEVLSLSFLTISSNRAAAAVKAVVDRAAKVTSTKIEAVIISL